MNHLNSVIMEGNVVRQAEQTEPVPGFKVCKFPLAVHRYYRDANGEGKEEVTYVDVEVYGNYGDSVVQNCMKGRGVRVVGRLKQNRWESEDGKKNSRLFIVAEHIEYRQKPNETSEFVKRTKGGDLNNMQTTEAAAYEEEVYEEAASF